MAGVIKTNSTLFARDVLYSTAQLKAFEIVPTTAITEGTIRAVANALNPMLMDVVTAGTSAALVMDGHANDAASIKARLEVILGETVTVTELDTLYGLS